MNAKVTRITGLFLIGLLVSSASASSLIVSQSPALLLDEAQTVYLGNLARRANGVPPLRWNGQLTEAARWFSWDSVENRPDPYCGHQDTQGNWPDYRARAFGYLGSAGAENAFCGYVTPQQAIDGWMNSPGHRANLLDPNSREIGLGYYLRDSDGRGYVTQDFGHDPVYPPVIIENEAISTTTSAVNLYIYDRETSGGFAGLSSATHMQISNDVCFTGAAWQTYAAEKSWTLSGGTGWRSVYVKTRDAFSRTVTVSDTIYLGTNVPLDQIGAAQMSTTSDRVKVYGLNTGGLPQLQFSLGWLADDTFSTFGLLWGNGQRVRDAAALVFDGVQLWVANLGDNTIQAIDPATRRAGAPIKVGSAPAALVYDGARLWVANANDGTVQAIDTATGEVVHPSRSGTVP